MKVQSLASTLACLALLAAVGYAQPEVQPVQFVPFDPELHHPVEPQGGYLMPLDSELGEPQFGAPLSGVPQQIVVPSMTPVPPVPLGPLPPHIQQMQEAMDEAMEAAQMRGMTRALWYHDFPLGMMVLGESPEVRTALGVSSEQMLQLSNMEESFATNLEMIEKMEVTRKYMEANIQATQINILSFDDNDLMSEADLMENIANTASIVTNGIEQEASSSFHLANEFFEAVMTPEQVRKMQEMQLAAMGMGDMPMQFVLAGAYEALDLTDAQRQEMFLIRIELEPEFEEKTNAMFRLDGLMDAKIAAAMREGEDWNETKKRLMAEDPEYKKIHEEILSLNKDFSLQFKTRIFDVLTDAQWKRLQELIDNPPEHARVYLKYIREQMQIPDADEEGAGEPESVGSDVWAPGPDSWRPGDAIPERYRRERNTRGAFPRPTE
ncbi:MAG: hypothetical protein FWG73_03680 [Planctomycetaceae bacterium]|nr:hypothetical protein [Planctomycetaceae bacterium]